MSDANTEPRLDTDEIDGHVVTRGCRYRPDLRRWEPLARVRPAWAPGAPEVVLPIDPADFQDTPDDAMAVAQRAVDQWLAEHGHRA